MTAALLRVDRLVTAYGKVDALRGVSLDVARGSITCLLGPNGAGKTTLLSTIAGLLRPRSGTVRFDGRDLTARAPHDTVARGVVLVPQNRLVFRNMTVRENLWIGAYRRHDKAEIEADLARLYERFPRLRDRQDQHAGTLSGGEQQMLALARALMSRPKLLLLDEPSFGLAPLIVEDVFRMIREINATGMTILLVEQNARLAFATAHQIYLVERGRVIFGGDPTRLAGDPLIHRAYLGQAEEHANEATPASPAEI